MGGFPFEDVIAPSSLVPLVECDGVQKWVLIVAEIPAVIIFRILNPIQLFNYVLTELIN